MCVSAGHAADLTVDLPVRGTLDLADYADHLTGVDGSASGFRVCSPGPGEGPGSVLLRSALFTETQYEYVEISVRQRAPDSLAVDLTGPTEVAQEVVEQVRRMLSCDLDGDAFDSVARSDPVLTRVHARRPGLRPVLFRSPYEAACWAVVCQGLSRERTTELVRALAESHGRVAGVGARRLWAFPPPHALVTGVRVPGLSALKRQRLELVAEVALEGRLDAAALRALPAADALAEVRGLPGVGPFSAELIVGRGAGHPDLFPLRETALRRAVAGLYGTADSEVELAGLAERWRPYRGWAAFVLRDAYVTCRRCALRPPARPVPGGRGEGTRL
ncbi:DNA-3-methyladenine glycosylase family protein [Saccharomonospora saliphila]|uniref:DNA-3-methyladenine glycosylase family protein n=1 Tax=Saccharomonospora saliphila TaxID=369829 RepID=UPI00037D72B4|nr:hypothetical protein [Saccharomonospora saliphila]